MSQNELESRGLSREYAQKYKLPNFFINELALLSTVLLILNALLIFFGFSNRFVAIGLIGSSIIYFILAETCSHFKSRKIKEAAAAEITALEKFGVVTPKMVRLTGPYHGVINIVSFRRADVFYDFKVKNDRLEYMEKF